MQAAQDAVNVTALAINSEAATAAAEAPGLDPTLVTMQKLAQELERRIAGAST